MYAVLGGLMKVLLRVLSLSESMAKLFLENSPGILYGI